MDLPIGISNLQHTDRWIGAPLCAILTFVRRIFEAAGSSKQEADIVAQHLVESSLAGVDSHGVIRIPEYVNKMLGKPIEFGKN